MDRSFSVGEVGLWVIDLIFLTGGLGVAHLGVFSVDRAPVLSPAMYWSNEVCIKLGDLVFNMVQIVGMV